MMQDGRTREIHKWLGSYDTSANYNAAKERRQKNTGQWLLKSSKYVEWKATPNARLWLSGKPGCGKTILSSTVIEDIFNSLRQQPRSALLYFYFRHDNKPTREHENQYSQMLRSLIVQLSCQIRILPKALDEIYENNLHGQRQPSNVELGVLLNKMAGDVDQVFLVLDALDECDD